MAENNVLTAEQGADRVLERWKKRRRRNKSDVKETEPYYDEDDESTPDYKCENCSSSVFIVIHTFDELQNLRLTLSCSCGDTDIAATEDFLVTGTNTCIGRLDSGHRVEWEEDEFEEKDRERVDYSIYCQRCFESPDFEWECEPLDDWETDEKSEYYEVRCEACGHEIEFGWSHPIRGSRIWPCESSDFNPWKCFPETRFIEAWKRRGWLRPIEKKTVKKRKE